MHSNGKRLVIMLLNGPPGCGKDTLANAFVRVHGFGHIEKFAQPIRDAAIATFPSVTRENFEKLKSEPLCDSQSTLRDWMIRYSEHQMKPMFGKHIFGKLLCERVQRQRALGDNLVIITDSGFAEEAQYLIDHLESDVRFVLVHMHRKSTSFAGDSRSHITLDDTPRLSKRELHNNATIEHGVQELYNAYVTCIETQ